MVARRDRGVAGIVMSTRLPFTTPDYLHDKRFAHEPKLDDTFREEGIAALVGVPLIWEGEVIGLLFVADRYHRTHTAQSISILCTLATHGAVALKNARDFERANAALAKAEPGARRARAARAQHPGRRPKRTSRSPRCWRAARRWRRCASRSRSCSAAACWCSTRPAQVVGRGTRAGLRRHRQRRLRAATASTAPSWRARCAASRQTAARWSPTRSTARPAARCR